MIFKVSEKFKGSCVLPTLKKAIWAKMVLSIAGNDLRADDIKDAVRKGILIPQDKRYKVENMEKDHDVMIINNTDRVLVLGKITLRPNGSIPISKDDAEVVEIVSAAKDDFITILSDEAEKPHITKKKTTKKSKKKAKKKIEESEDITPETGEDKEPTAVAWNFKTKEIEEAQKVPQCEEFVNINEEKEDIDFINGEADEPVTKKTTKKKITKKKKISKKINKKKVSTKKKKVNNTKKRKVKKLEPVGEKRLPKTEAEAAMELDSRGNPIGEKVSDTLKHLIDEINVPEDVGFVDDEQALNGYKNRTDMD